MKTAFRSPDIDESLIKISDVVPQQFRSIFKYDRFNAMQSIIVPQVMQSDVNMVIAAPTGSGKTVVHELAILRLMLTANVRDIKCVFIAPNKALCQQRCSDWQNSFGNLGLSVMEVTGDIDMSRSLQLVAKANIIVTTPEKWDSLTRSWRRHLFLLGAIDLLLLDEVHHLGEERGPTLETVVVRMRILCEAYSDKIREAVEKNGEHGDNAKAIGRTAPCVRIIALSATLPNLADIGDWLNCAPESVHYFDEEFRPVPLSVHTLSYGSAKAPFLFERSLDEKVFDVIKNHSGGKQTLIFCSSKKGTENLSKLLLSKMGNQRKGFASTNGEKFIQDSLLRDLVSKGFGYHHGGLPPDDRAAVEELYLSGMINVLCSTSTLAHGVNLPAHLVIIKGTYCWRGGVKGYETLPKSEIIQMMGRAGRPGFDTQGVAVIMTSSEEKKNYEKITLSADVVESRLPTILIEAICAEITQNVIGSLQEAIQWLKSTYFYIRVKRNPHLYGFLAARDADHLDTMLMDMCIKALADLSTANVIKYDAATFIVEALTEAHIMTRNMIKFPSMVLMMKLPRDSDIPQLLMELSRCEELLKPLRRNEKVILNGFMKSIRYPLKTKVQDSAIKAYVLMLAAPERLFIQDFSLRVEQSEIVEVALRVLSALQSLCIERSIGCLLETAILVDRAIRVRMWEVDYGSVFFQCQGLSDLTKKGLNERRALTLNDIQNCSQFRIQDLLACSANEAKQVLSFTSMCNLWVLDLRVDYGYSTNGLKSCMKIDIVHANSIDQNLSQVGQQSSSEQSGSMDQQSMELNPPLFQLICYHAQTSVLLCHRRLDFNGSGRQSHNIGGALLSFTVPLPEDMFLGDVKCVLLSSIVGLDTALLPRGMTPVTPQLTVTKVKKQHKGSIPSNPSDTKIKKDIGVAVGSRITIQKRIDNTDLSTNITDGDMRSWMVKKIGEKSGDVDTEKKRFPAKPTHSEGLSTPKNPKLPNLASTSKLEHIKVMHENIAFDESVPWNVQKMDFTRSGYHSKVSSDHDYFSQFNHQPFRPIPPNSFVSSRHVEEEDSKRLDLGIHDHQEQKKEQVKQFNQRIISDSTFIAYESDDNDDEPFMLDCSSNSRKQSHQGNDDTMIYSAMPIAAIPQASNFGVDNIKSTTDSSIFPPSTQRTQQATNQSGALTRTSDAKNLLAFDNNSIKSKNTSYINGSRTNDFRGRSANDHGYRQSSQYDDMKFISAGTRNFNHTHAEVNAPSFISGGNSRNSSVGGCSTELATLRRKNIELQLDTIPVKRMRTAASPGFLRPEKGLKQRAELKSASILDDSRYSSQMVGKFDEKTDESGSGRKFKEFDAVIGIADNVDYYQPHVQSEDLPKKRQSDQSSGSQDIEILKVGQLSQNRKPEDGFDNINVDRQRFYAMLPNDRYALSSFFDDEADGSKEDDSTITSTEPNPWEIDRTRSNQHQRYGGEKYAKISNEMQLTPSEKNSYIFQRSEGQLDTRRSRAPHRCSVQDAVIPPNRNCDLREVTPSQVCNRLQEPIDRWNQSSMGGIRKIAEPYIRTTENAAHLRSTDVDSMIHQLPGSRVAVGNLIDYSEKGFERSSELRADEPLVLLEGGARVTGKSRKQTPINQTSSSPDDGNFISYRQRISVTPSNLSSTPLLVVNHKKSAPIGLEKLDRSTLSKKNDVDDLFDSGFF